MVDEYREGQVNLREWLQLGRGAGGGGEARLSVLSGSHLILLPYSQPERLS